MKPTLYIPLIFVLSLLLSPVVANAARDYRVGEVPNPRMRCADCYVTDEAGALSGSTVNELNAKLSALERRTSAEVAVVILPGIEGDDETSFAYSLASQWGVGKSGRNNGLLFLYVVDLRGMRFETGTGLEGILPDAYLNTLLNEGVFPLMREGRTDEAFTLAIDHICSRLSSDEAVQEMLLGTDSPRVRYVNWLMYYLIASCLIFIIALWWAYRHVARVSGENNIRYMALDGVVRGVKPLAWVFPLPVCFLFFYLRGLRRRARVRPIACPSCGSKMRLLTESQEDVYLTKGQQIEETLKSVDYDVWLCPSCGEIKIYSYLGYVRNCFWIREDISC